MEENGPVLGADLSFRKLVLPVPGRTDQRSAAFRLLRNHGLLAEQRDEPDDLRGHDDVVGTIPQVHHTYIFSTVVKDRCNL